MTSVVLGLVLVSAGAIVSASKVYVSLYDPVYRHLSFSASVLSQLGTMFITLPLIIGGIIRGDLHHWVRVIMIIMGCLLLGARFA